MKKVFIILTLVFWVSFIDVFAATCTEQALAGTKGTGYCTITSNYIFEETCQHENATYSSEVSTIYSKYATTATEHYSTISCREMIAFTAPNISSVSIYSGVGFDYSPITVTNTFVCRGTFQYKLFTADYKKAKDSTKKAMLEELLLYQKWTNEINSRVQSTVNASNLEVTIKDIKNSKYYAINSLTEMTNQTSKIDQEKLAVNKASDYTVSLWVKKIDVVSTFEPVEKKTITSGPNYGKVILGNEECSNCTTPDRKLYTDYEIGSGNYGITINIDYKNKDWTIASDCGYNIYNSGSVNWVSQFQYRQISLSNPFPNGATGYWKDWKANKLITGNEYDNTPKYVVKLDADSIKSIRNYNKSNRYNSELSSNGNYQNGKYQSNFLRSDFASLFTKAG